MTNPWKDAIIDATVVGWVYTAEHETNPRKAVNDLLCWERKMALDPAISQEAHALVQRAEIAEHKVEQLRKMLAQFQEALTQTRTVLRPWLDKAAGRQGTVSLVEWDAAIRSIDSVLSSLQAQRDAEAGQ